MFLPLKGARDSRNDKLQLVLRIYCVHGYMVFVLEI